jgi:hypothetical protein
MRGAQFACGLFGRVVDVGFVFVGGGDLEFAVEDRDEIRGKADTDKDSAELFFGSEGTNDGFAELKAMRLRVITAGEELLHGFMQVGAGLVKRIVAGVFASEAAKVGAVGDAIHLGEEKPGGDAGSWLVRVLDGDDWGMQVCLYILKKQIPRGKEPPGNDRAGVMPRVGGGIRWRGCGAAGIGRGRPGRLGSVPCRLR